MNSEQTDSRAGVPLSPACVASNYRVTDTMHNQSEVQILFKNFTNWLEPRTFALHTNILLYDNLWFCKYKKNGQKGFTLFANKKVSQPTVWLQWHVHDHFHTAVHSAICARGNFPKSLLLIVCQVFINHNNFIIWI